MLDVGAGSDGVDVEVAAVSKVQRGRWEHRGAEEQAADSRDTGVKAEGVPDVDAGGGAEVVVAGDAVGFGIEGLLLDAGDDLLRLPGLAGEDVGVGCDEVGLVGHVEARLAPADELEEELVEARSGRVVSADALDQRRDNRRGS